MRARESQHIKNKLHFAVITLYLCPDIKAQSDNLEV